MRKARVVPLAVEVRSLQSPSLPLASAHLAAHRIVPRIEGCLDAQPRGRAGTANEADEHLAAQQRLSTPVRGARAHHAVRARVPFARARRQRADRSTPPRLLGEPLQRGLPAPRTGTVAATPSCRDAQLLRPRIHGRAHLAPPRPARRSREHGGLMVHAHADPTEVGAEVVDAGWDGLAELLLDEVLPAARGRMPRGVPLTASLLAVAEACLLLGIAREDWLAAALQGLHPGVEMLAVRVAVRVLASLTGRACSLYAVVRRMAPRAHKRGADPVPLRFELGRALADTLARPAPR